MIKKIKKIKKIIEYDLQLFLLRICLQKCDVVFAVHIRQWKRDMIRRIFNRKKIVFMPFELSPDSFKKKWKKILLRNNSSILVWGMNLPKWFEDFCRSNNIEVTYVEDGFIRSIELGSKLSLPLSLTFDTLTPYFNANKESQLENLLNNYDFAENPEILVKAKIFKQKLLSTGISKYNHNKEKIDVKHLYNKKNRKRILVIGQVEDDASILFGCDTPKTNRELAIIAINENPDAEVIYKPHPDVMNGLRKELSKLDDLSDKITIINVDISISQAFDGVDHVYTITSQVGFEALLRDIEVTVLGAPFYSGWGLTNDRYNVLRRVRKLSVDHLVAVVYLIYPKYFDLNTFEEITPQKGLEYLINQRLTC